MVLPILSTATLMCVTRTFLAVMDVCELTILGFVEDPRKAACHTNCRSNHIPYSITVLDEPSDYFTDSLVERFDDWLSSLVVWLLRYLIFIIFASFGKERHTLSLSLSWLTITGGRVVDDQNRSRPRSVLARSAVRAIPAHFGVRCAMRYEICCSPPGNLTCTGYYLRA